MTDEGAEAARIEGILTAMRDELRSVVDSCPSGEELLAAVDAPEGPPPEVALHLERCAECRSLAERLGATKDEGGADAGIQWPTDDERARVEERLDRRPAPWRETPAASRARSPGVLALAAAVVAVLGGGFLLLSPEGPGPEVPSGPRGELLVAEAPRGVVEGEVVFRWAPSPLATAYRVVLEDASGPVWTGETTAPPLRLPGDETTRLAPGAEVRWRVTALDPAGRELGSSAWVEISVGGQ